MIEVKNINFSYGQNVILDNVSFKIETGEVVALLGANGVGKTTILKIITGIIRLDEKDGGIVLIDGNVPQEKAGEIAYISEKGTAIGSFTTQKHGEFLAEFFENFDMDEYKLLCTEYDLFKDNQIKTFSRGERAKLEVVSGLCKRTPYIIMDEPFEGKDIFTRKDFLRKVSEKLTGEETVIITTHEISEIENFIDRVIILNGTHVVADMYVDEIRENNQTIESVLLALGNKI